MEDEHAFSGTKTEDRTIEPDLNSRGPHPKKICFQVGYYPGWRMGHGAWTPWLEEASQTGVCVERGLVRLEQCKKKKIAISKHTTWIDHDDRL